MATHAAIVHATEWPSASIAAECSAMHAEVSAPVFMQDKRMPQEYLQRQYCSGL